MAREAVTAQHALRERLGIVDLDPEQQAAAHLLSVQAAVTKAITAFDASPDQIAAVVGAGITDGIESRKRAEHRLARRTKGIQ